MCFDGAREQMFGHATAGDSCKPNYFVHIYYKLLVVCVRARTTCTYTYTYVYYDVVYKRICVCVAVCVCVCVRCALSVRISYEYCVYAYMRAAPRRAIEKRVMRRIQYCINIIQLYTLKGILLWLQKPFCSDCYWRELPVSGGGGVALKTVFFFLRMSS